MVIRSTARRLPPVTGFVLAAQALTFLAEFFTERPLLRALDFVPGAAAAAPWSAITYPLHGAGSPLFLFFAGYVFYWVAGDLERRWGSREMAGFLLAITLAGAASYTVAAHVLHAPVGLSGLSLPLVATFFAWCMLNPRATVLIMFVLPVQARWLGLAGLALLYLDAGPVLGLFALVAPLLAWWYARRGRYALKRRVSRPEPVAARPRVHGLGSMLLHPIATWRRRRRLAEFKRLMVEHGLRDPDPDQRPN